LTYFNQNVEKLDKKTPEIEAEKQLNSIERFFDTTLNTWVRKLRFFIILGGFALSGYSGYRCLDIQGLSSLEKYFNDDHEVMVAFKTIANDYNEGEQA
jgi:hypothetical protein